MSFFYKDSGIPGTDTEKTFHTYQNYLSCFMKHIKDEYSDPQTLFEFLWQKVNPSKSTLDIDIKNLRRFLFIAWNTEFLSGLNDSQSAEILKINNQWKPVQVYYSVYSMGEALSYVMDGTMTESHSKCIDKLNSWLVESLKIAPWCLAYSGTQRNGLNSVNFPGTVQRESNLKISEADPLGMISTCLRAEHNKQIEEFIPRKLTIAQQLRGEKKKLKLDYDPSYTTLLDFLYRLRIKSNYKDAEIFIMDAPDEHIKGFSKNISNLVFCTLMLFEIYIIKRWDKDEFIKLANEYIKNLNGENKTPLEGRVRFYTELAK